MPVPAEIRPPNRTAPRYYPSRPLPAYRFVPGRHPHPRRDRDGHSYAMPQASPGDWDPAAWRTLGEWLFGVDLFNAFFFWEAHEAWEALWAAKPRDSAPARLLQGMIQIAAALLKVHLGAAAAAATLSRAGLDKLAASASVAPTLLGLDVRATLTHFTHYFRPLSQRTLPPLDGSVPLVLLPGWSDA